MRAITVENLLQKEFKVMEFDGDFLASFGTPELSGVWFIWGESGNGKTSFLLALCKYLTEFGKVAYDTLEEGARKSFKDAIIRAQMEDVSNNFVILNREPINELKERLSKRRSPDIIVIDSFQYTGMSKGDYIKLKEQFPTKLFIFNSHAEGKQPEGRPARFVRYDADVKIRVEGYKAFPVSRYGGGEPFVIWEEGAKKYWNEIE